MEHRRPTVLYIAGSGRSGSTLVGNVLGHLPGLVSVGEFCDFPKEFSCAARRESTRLCGCGATVHDCDFWRTVFTRAFGEFPDAAEWVRIHALARSIDRTRYSFPMATAAGRALLRRRIDRYASLLGRVYGAIDELTGGSIIVDSSKIPSHAELLMEAGCDVSVIHLIRDPRACAYSWQRHKEDVSGQMPRHQPFVSTAMYVGTHLAIERRLRSQARGYIRVRYEDFCDEPEATLQRALQAVGIDRPMVFTPDRTVKLEPLHCISGNPDRFKCGVVPIVKDSEWQSRMTWPARAASTLAALPILRRHGYQTPKAAAPIVRGLMAAGAIAAIVLMLYVLPTALEIQALTVHPFVATFLLGNLVGCAALALRNWRHGIALYVALFLIELGCWRFAGLRPMLIWVTDLPPTLVVGGLLIGRFSQ